MTKIADEMRLVGARRRPSSLLPVNENENALVHDTK